MAAAVPDLTEKTQEQIIAEGYLRKMDITFKEADTPVAGFSKKVYDQSIRSGVVVAYGIAITLTISPEEPPAQTEPAPTPTTAPTTT